MKAWSIRPACCPAPCRMWFRPPSSPPQIGGDAVAFASLQPSLFGVLRLSFTYYILLAQPSPLLGEQEVWCGGFENGPLLIIPALECKESAGAGGIEQRDAGSRVVAISALVITRTRFPPPGLLDFYVSTPLARLTQQRFTEDDFTLRDRLGGGNYGQGGVGWWGGGWWDRCWSARGTLASTI